MRLLGFIFLRKYRFDLVLEVLRQKPYTGNGGFNGKIDFVDACNGIFRLRKMQRVFFYCPHVSTFELMYGRNNKFDIFNQGLNRFTGERKLDLEKKYPRLGSEF